jgi:hypothetical protein
MKVTKKMIKELYSTQRVEQVDSKQLFLAYLPKLATFVYISYRTIIGLRYGEEWLITNEWHSRTTSCHKYEIMKMENNARQVKQCYFKDKLDKLRLAN